MHEVVCNTSPLQYLHQIGVLEILPAIYGRILVPQAVVNEISAGRQAGVSLPDLASLDWVEAREVAPTSWPVPRDIHRGEAEVIALARLSGNAKVILDDLAARKHAKLLGLIVTGTLGVLLKAKEKRLIGNLRPHTESLTACGFRLADSTRNEFLRMAGE
jgi:predicted nucleic acid-binding protein